MGDTTFGKCTSQKYIELTDGSALLLTNLLILRPSKQYCNGEGIKPDLYMPLSEFQHHEIMIRKGLNLLKSKDITAIN